MVKICWELGILRSDTLHLLQCLKRIWSPDGHGETGEQFNEQPKGEEYDGEVPVLQHKDILPVLKTWFIKSGTVGGVRVTVLCITSRSFSKMLSKNINV